MSEALSLICSGAWQLLLKVSTDRLGLQLTGVVGQGLDGGVGDNAAWG